MLTKDAKVKEAVAEAKRFLVKHDAWAAAERTAYSYMVNLPDGNIEMIVGPVVERAAAIRSSLDLTRALSAMRRR